MMSRWFCRLALLTLVVESAIPIGGMGIALALQAWSAYGQKPITESDIEREMQRQRER
jgi:hypothetical protein